MSSIPQPRHFPPSTSATSTRSSPLFLATILLLFAGAPTAADVPKNDGWVTDLGDMLTDSQERSLETLMESYKRGTSHEIALLTLPDLDGANLESLSLEVARTWGLGGEDANNGALLLISRDDRKMRIEVGRGLEGTLTDSVSGRIIRDVISPSFKRGRFEPGIRSGIVAMHAAIGGDYGPIEESARTNQQGGSLFQALVPLLILLFFFLGNKGDRGGRGHSNLPLWLLLSSSMGGGRRGGGSGGGGFSGFGGGGGFSGGGASGGW